jgi:DNA-binding MarR family transcriptional regulator
MSLRDEIKQTRPFSSPLEETLLNIVRTAGLLTYAATEVLRPHGLTTTQYNVLRILRGAGAAGLPCGAIAERMITRDSDITRLLDRLGAMHLVVRGRLEQDRRVVTVTLTEKGRQLLEQLDPVVRQMHQDQLGHMDEASLSTLIRGLERARERALAITEATSA